MKSLTAAFRKVNWKTKGLEVHDANEILVYVRDIKRLKEENKQRIEKCINFMFLSQSTYPNLKTKKAYERFSSPECRTKSFLENHS